MSERRSCTLRAGSPRRSRTPARRPRSASRPTTCWRKVPRIACWPRSCWRRVRRRKDSRISVPRSISSNARAPWSSWTVSERGSRRWRRAERRRSGMRAAVHTRYGPPDVVRIADVEKPTAGEHEVLVKVHATTVNRTDCGFRSGKPCHRSALQRARASRRRPSSDVSSRASSRRSAAASRPSRSATRCSGSASGGSARRRSTCRCPRTVRSRPCRRTSTFEEAACSTEGSHYALSMITKAKIESGQHVLVNGATGAIGSAAVQLLKRLGAVVTAVCATEHVELVRGLGADRVIDYTAEDFTKDAADVRRGPGRGRQELVPPMQAAAEATRDLRLVGPRLPRPESDPGVRHAAVQDSGSCSPSRRSTAGRAWMGSRRCSSRGSSRRSSIGGIRWTRSSRRTGTSRRGRRSATS